MPYPESMIKLIEELAKLPGVGRRTAERFALYILSAPKESVESMARLLLKVNESIHSCEICYNLSEKEICHICADPTRDHSSVFVVQDPKDVIAVEKAGDFNGIYHVLMGTLSPLEGIGPKDLKIRELIERVKEGGVREIILGMASDTEGDATSLYLVKQLRSFSTPGGKVRITRIAHGVPVGSALDFVDKATLARAFKQRQEV